MPASPESPVDRLRLDIVLPAYNEEAAIEGIIRRCLEARRAIIRDTQVSEVTVTVVSDGSRDRTALLARAFEPEIRLIDCEKNQGYGAAIKTGFATGSGELVAFLDADGTCDPAFLAPMVNALLEQHASVSVGSRMGPRSKMPPIRRLGNRVWRRVINWLAEARITDAASGMRVIRRDALPLLEPLPDGLHYTPTMSCRAALDARLTIVEVPIDYQERVGRSKLSVLRDGLRFLQTIVDVGLTYQPFRLISIPGFALLMLAALLFLPVVAAYIHTRHIAEGEIYRILTVVVAATAGLQMFLAGLAGERAVDLIHPKKWHGGRFLVWLKRILTERRLAAIGVGFIAATLSLNAYGLWTFAASGYVRQHWSRAAIGGMLALLGLQCLAAAILDRTFRLLAGLPAARMARENAGMGGLSTAARGKGDR